MTSERIRRRIESLLDDADAAVDAGDWNRVRERADAVQRLDPGNEDARAYLEAAQRAPARPAAALASGGQAMPARQARPGQAEATP